MEKYRYILEAKEQYVMPNILGGRSYPVYTYRWVGIALSNDIDSLIEYVGGRLTADYRIVDRTTFRVVIRGI